MAQLLSKKSGRYLVYSKFAKSDDLRDDFTRTSRVIEKRIFLYETYQLLMVAIDILNFSYETTEILSMIWRALGWTHVIWILAVFLSYEHNKFFVVVVVTESDTGRRVYHVQFLVTEA